MEIQEIRRKRLQDWFEGKSLPSKEKSYLSQLINGKASFGERAARRIEQTYGMGADYLDRDYDSTYQQKPAPAIPAGASVVAYDNPDELDPDRYVWIDRYDINLSAGCGNIQWVVNQKDPICFRAAWFKFKGLPVDDCKALYVRGRSMEPVLQDYDTVLIDTSKKDIIDGDVYAVCLDDQFYIKAVHRKPGMVVLRSYNKDFEDIEVVGEQMNQLCIIGKMVWRGG